MEELQTEGEQITQIGNKLVFKISGKVFTSKIDTLKMRADNRCKTTDSAVAKLIIGFFG